MSIKSNVPAIKPKNWPISKRITVVGIKINQNKLCFEIVFFHINNKIEIKEKIHNPSGREYKNQFGR